MPSALTFTPTELMKVMLCVVDRSKRKLPIADIFKAARESKSHMMALVTLWEMGELEHKENHKENKA